MTTPLSEFIQYLLKGLSVVALTFSAITFDIYNTTFTLMDLMTYTGIIGFSLTLIDKVSKSGAFNRGKVKGEKKHG